MVVLTERILLLHVTEGVEQDKLEEACLQTGARQRQGAVLVVGVRNMISSLKRRTVSSDLPCPDLTARRSCSPLPSTSGTAPWSACLCQALRYASTREDSKKDTLRNNRRRAVGGMRHGPESR